MRPMFSTRMSMRSSSPVRIVRGDFKECYLGEDVLGGCYPCGEGAGYAGGIMSAAMDGMKVAEAIIGEFASFSQD